MMNSFFHQTWQPASSVGNVAYPGRQCLFRCGSSLTLHLAPLSRGTGEPLLWNAPALVQGAATAAWECCSSGFHCALKVLAALEPAHRDAAALSAVVTFLVRSISWSHGGCEAGSVAVLAWSRAALASGLIAQLRVNTAVIR